MLDALRHLLLIVEHGTFTEAARRAHLSQPALSASIRRLEADLGAPLLERGRTGAKLTAAGQAMLPHARATIAAMRDARRSVTQVVGVERGEVRIGAGATACTYVMPPYVAKFRRRHPGVRIFVQEIFTKDVFDGLADGTLDLGIVSGSRGERWIDDELILVGAPGVDALGAALITFPKGTNTRELVERHFPEADIAMELASIASVKGNVRAGIGVALVSRAAVRHDLKTGRLVEVPDPRTPLPRQLRIAHRGRRLLSPAAAALRQTLLRART